MADSAPRPYVMDWRLWDKRVVIVGGGQIGEGKIETLLASGADLVVIDPTPSERVVDLASAGRITLHQRRARRLDFRKTTLVVAATGDSETNAWCARWGRRFGAIINAVDEPALCDVTVPAVINRGPATIAITTNGRSPAGARFLREELSKAVPDDVGLLLEHAAAARDSLRHNGSYRYDYAAWRQLFFEPGLNAIEGHRTHALAEVRSRFLAEFSTATTPLRTGRITLVGAGPGGVDLITVRGANALREADVVLYDRLADPALLELAPAAAVRVPVGKGKGHGLAQEEISALLVDHARDGNHVVRLKGGDPFIFGQGAEEIDTALHAGIPVEVVPGLTSSVAAATLAGIPLTDRRVASGFAVVSGHRAGQDDYDWSAFASDELTVVALMAASTADRVAARLLEHGRKAQTPVAFVHRAGHSDEQIEVLSLGDVSLSGCPLASPTVMIIGDVAGFARMSHATSGRREQPSASPAQV